MPRRKTLLLNDEIYHVYNRGTNRQPTFVSKRDYDRALLTLKYYLYANPPVKLSRYLASKEDAQKYIDERLLKVSKNVELLAFCLMPNHFHFLLKQNLENGTSKFLANFQNSYTKYFNKKHDRDGQIFLDQFKAVRIETDEQLIHVHRYIHLNPYTSGIVKSINDLISYNYSSLNELLDPRSYMSSNSSMKSLIKTPDKYWEFLKDQSGYQKKLHLIRHLTYDP